MAVKSPSTVRIPRVPVGTRVWAKRASPMTNVKQMTNARRGDAGAARVDHSVFPMAIVALVRCAAAGRALPARRMAMIAQVSRVAEEWNVS